MILFQVGQAFAQSEQLIDSLNKLGSIHLEAREFDPSLAYFSESLEIYESLPDKSKAEAPYHYLGKLYWYKENFKQAILYFNRSLQHFKSNGNLEGVAETQSNLGTMYGSQGNYDESLIRYDSSYQSFIELGDLRNAALTLKSIGIVYSVLGENQNALEAYRKGIPHAQQNNDEKLLNTLWVFIGLAYIQLHQEDSSEFYLTQSLAYYKKTREFKRLIQIYQMLGKYKMEIGQLPKSIQLYTEALEASEEIKDTVEIGNMYGLIADVYRLQNDLSEALMYQEKALDNYVIRNDSSRIAHALSGLANMYLEMPDYKKALALGMQSFAIYESYQDSCQFSKCFLAIGKAFAGIGKLDSARFYLDQTIPQASKCIKNDLIAEAHYEIGKIYSLQKQEANATLSYEQALSFANQVSNREIIKASSGQLYPIYQKRGQYKKAFETLELFQASKDSLFNAENTRHLVQMEMEYAFEKEEQENAILQQQKDAEQQRLVDRQRWFLIFASLACLFLIGIAATTYRNFQIKKKANALLNEQNIEIAKQKAELQQMDEMKSRFFANISHELRTPLTLISSPIDQLLQNQREELGAGVVDDLQLMKRNTKELKGLVNDIMDLSKLESNKIECYFEEVPVVSFIKRTVSNFDSLAKHIDIEYKAAIHLPKDVHLKMDAGKVEKIINNLLSNAIKHTPSGGKVSLTAQEKNQQLLVQVSDSGKGIAEEDLPYIFDRYFQSKQSDSALQGGTGIGLALARELAHLMDGTISVTSAINRGSTFSLSLPYTEILNSKKGMTNVVMDDEAEINLQHLQPAISSGNDKKHHILIVEDHPDMQQFINRLLKNKYHTHVANQGKQALDMLEKESIDLIVSDVMMPEMDGYTLLEKLKAHDDHKGIPVIMLTALDNEDHKLKALTLGVDDYLGKPFSPEELLARSHNLLERYDIRRNTKNETEAEIETNEIKTLEKPDSEIIHSSDHKWLKNVEEIMHRELENPNFNLSDLASQLFLSERQFQRRMKKAAGLTPKKFQIEVALQEGRNLLEKKAYSSIKAVAYSIGMSNVWRFTQLYESRFGKKPSDYF